LLQLRERDLMKKPREEIWRFYRKHQRQTPRLFCLELLR
jgi:hypothetical protein